MKRQSIIRCLIRGSSQASPASLPRLWSQPCYHTSNPFTSRTTTRQTHSSDAHSRERGLYETHVPLSLAQKATVAVLGSFLAAAKPARADLVAAVGETTGYWALQQVRGRMLKSAEGRAVLADMPRVTDDLYQSCKLMPAGSFGQAYAQFMEVRGFMAGERPPVRFVDDVELAYVMQRVREVHDYWHVLFDCHTNVFGELALKALEFVQTGLPMPALAVLGAQWRLSPEQRALMYQLYLPWALRAGSRSQDLMCIYYEKALQEDLEVVRQKWRILPAPVSSMNKLKKPK